MLHLKGSVPERSEKYSNNSQDNDKSAKAKLIITNLLENSICVERTNREVAMTRNTTSIYGEKTRPYQQTAIKFNKLPR